MKLKFKKQPFQTDAVEAVASCFQGQPRSHGVRYRIDSGREEGAAAQLLPGMEASGFKNDEIMLPPSQLLRNIQSVQKAQNLPLSNKLASGPVCDVNLDIEMETGTGKTYCYIKTMFELHQRFGWSKFIIVVPTIAIREGVHKSLEITAEHFLEHYGKRARFFIYDSRQLSHLESFSSDAGVNVMIINVQAFNARGQDARRIYEELDEFQSRRPIDAICRNRPILILDEPQKMEGAKTVESLKGFTPLMILRYSATHRMAHDKIYRLDAVDAYNQKLVKKIAVRGISIKGLAGSSAYLYLESIAISPARPPEARVELEVLHVSGIKRVVRKLGRNDNLHEVSGGLESYKGFVVADVDAIDNTVSFTNGTVLQLGEITGDVNEGTLRRLQIRESIQAHLEKEQALFVRGIKVLTLFFIDEVSRYRRYAESGEQAGDYAKIFEEEYALQSQQVAASCGESYRRYLAGIVASKTHGGYFSIDRRTKRLVDPKAKRAGADRGEADDVDAYDLILRDKERLLSLDEPVRFIFSHSALREGWDNPNVFVICALKHSDPANVTARRQEVGRGLRIAVNQDGDRMDDPATVHQVNVLTVIASESYQDFVAGLQRDITATLSERARRADEAYFTGKVLHSERGDLEVTEPMAKAIYKYLLKNDYTDGEDRITAAYHQARDDGRLAPLPADLDSLTVQVFQLIDTVFSEARLPGIIDERRVRANPLNANFERKEFLELWARINLKAAYAVQFQSDELIEKCIASIDGELRVVPLQFTVQRGEQADAATYEAVTAGVGFKVQSSATSPLEPFGRSSVRYDHIGKLAEATTLTRSTVALILRGIKPDVFGQYRTNPEDFLIKAARVINEQKATVIIEHLTYDPIGQTHSLDIFTVEKPMGDFRKTQRVERHIYDYVFTDAATERTFVRELDAGTNVEVYAKLPRGFSIPTPVGNYNPDWAIVFRQGSVKHVYFIAETKGSMSSMQLRKIEECKVDCARKFFARITSDQVKYGVVDSYERLMELVS